MSSNKRKMLYASSFCFALGLAFVVGFFSADWLTTRYQEHKAIWKAQQQLSLLRADMNVEQVVATLGLSNYARPNGGWGGLNIARHYILIGNTGNELTIISYMDQPLLISVSLSGATWQSKTPWHPLNEGQTNKILKAQL